MGDVFDEANRLRQAHRQCPSHEFAIANSEDAPLVLPGFHVNIDLRLPRDHPLLLEELEFERQWELAETQHCGSGE